FAIQSSSALTPRRWWLFAQAGLSVEWDDTIKIAGAFAQHAGRRSEGCRTTFGVLRLHLPIALLGAPLEAQQTLCRRIKAMPVWAGHRYPRFARFFVR